VSGAGDAFVRFEEVTYRFGEDRAPAVDRVELDVGGESITAVLGPNGAGKTTLLYLALGWYRPTGGRVLLEGRDLSLVGQRERGRAMSLVPQREHIPFEYSALEYVMLGRAPHLRTLEVPGPGHLRVAREALSTVGLTGRHGESINRLSGGERQLLLIARSLSQQPRLLLLDEPTSHLDLKNKRRVVDLLKSLAERGVSILLTTHLPEVAAALADRIVLMREGSILLHGPPGEILTEENLSGTYGVDLRVRDVAGNRLPLWF
jgi:iron complex transport system ATP-binding protein